MIEHFVLSAPAADKNPKKINPTRIRLNGKFLVLASGKTLWRRKGDAKNALRNYLGYKLNEIFERRGYQDVYFDGQKIDLSTKDQIIKETILEIYKLVEFVEIDDSAILNQK